LKHAGVSVFGLRKTGNVSSVSQMRRNEEARS